MKFRNKKELNDFISQSKVAALNTHLKEEEPKKSKIVKPRNDCAEVQWIHWQLKYYCLDEKIEFEKEYYFAKPRKFRFDFALPKYKIAVEYDGVMSEKSGHTTLVGMSSDNEKINLAISLGWRVLRYTVITYERVLQDVKKLINDTTFRID